MLRWIIKFAVLSFIITGLSGCITQKGLELSKEKMDKGEVGAAAFYVAMTPLTLVFDVVNIATFGSITASTPEERRQSISTSQSVYTSIANQKNASSLSNSTVKPTQETTAASKSVEVNTPTTDTPNVTNNSPKVNETLEKEMWIPGSAAPASCIKAKKLRGGINISDYVVKNVCNKTIHLKGACLPSKYPAKKDYPMNGVYTLGDQWAYSLEPGEEHPDVSLEMCKKNNGKHWFAYCTDGDPFFGSPNGDTFNCFISKEN